MPSFYKLSILFPDKSNLMRPRHFIIELIWEISISAFESISIFSLWGTFIKSSTVSSYLEIIIINLIKNDIYYTIFYN